MIVIKRYSRETQFSYFLKYGIRSKLRNDQKKPILCGFKLTNRCNLKCRHCPFWRGSKLEELSFKRVKEIIKVLHNDGVRIIIFEGGEPFIWKDKKWDIGDVIDFAKQYFFIVGITTNGTIDLSKADPDIIFVSIDGLKKTHDKIRGEVFDKVIKNIENNQYNKRIIANICISKTNHKEIPALIKFIDSKVFGITIQFFYPYPNTEDLRISQKYRKEILEKIINLKKEGYKILDSKSCLSKLINNDWACNDFLVSSVDPDGKINYGCYLKNRVDNISCKDCGFAAHCEISLAYQLDLGAINAAKKIFW